MTSEDEGRAPLDLVPVMVPRVLFEIARPYPAMVNEKTVSEYFGMTETDFLEAVRRGKIKARKFQGKRYVAFEEIRKLLSPKGSAPIDARVLETPPPSVRTESEIYKAPPPPKLDDARLEAVVKRSLHRTRR